MGQKSAGKKVAQAVCHISYEIWHTVYGGYYDNYGMAALVECLDNELEKPGVNIAELSSQRRLGQAPRPRVIGVYVNFLAPEERNVYSYAMNNSLAPSGAASGHAHMPLLTELRNNATSIYKHCAPPERGNAD